jgi:hypothetical protein
MRHIVLLTFFILMFCIVALSQNCPNFKLKSPEVVTEGDFITLSAVFEKAAETETPLHWTVIKGKALTREVGDAVIVVDSTGVEDDENITVIAEIASEKCKQSSVAVTKVKKRLDCGLTAKIDEYGKIEWDEEKARLDNVSVEINARKDSELFAYFEFSKNTTKKYIKSRLLNVANHFSSLGIEKNRITLVVSTTEREMTYFEIKPLNYSGYSIGDFIIRAEDFDKLERFFQNKKPKKN